MDHQTNRSEFVDSWRTIRVRSFVSIGAAAVFILLADWSRNRDLNSAEHFASISATALLIYSLINLGRGLSPRTLPTKISSDSKSDSLASHNSSSIRFARTALWLAPIAITVIAFGLFYNEMRPLMGKTLAESGQFGDSFGVLNALFTGLGFCGLVITLLLQQRQMVLQEKEIRLQVEGDRRRHFEETLHRLMGLYSQALAEVANAKGSLRGRSVLRGSTDRAFEAIKREQIHIVPLKIQNRHKAKQLTDSDRQFLDFLYFRNFKVLSVEIDRQGRLTETLKVLLRHLVDGAPHHLSITPYQQLICAQITYVELSYFYLVALTFDAESDLRKLLLESGLLARAAHVKRLRIHDYMYLEFWGHDLREFKKPQLLPISESRISNAVRARRRALGLERHVNLTTYSSPRTRQPKDVET